MRKSSKKKSILPPTIDLKRSEYTKGEDIEITVERIDLDDIDVEQQVIRDLIDDDHIIELSMSMTRQGLLEPIIVEPANGRYKLAAGLHRLIAAHRLKWQYIYASVRVPEKGVPLKIIALTENVMRRDLTFAEECQAVIFLHDEEKLSCGQITTMLGKSRSWVERRLMAPHLPIEVREALFDNFISIGVAEKLGLIEDQGMRNEILNKAVFGKLNKKEVSVLIDLYTEGCNVYEAIEEGLEAAKAAKVQKGAKRLCEACQAPRDISGLRPIWICKDGCDEERLRDSVQGKNDNGGQDDDRSKRPDGNR